MLRYLVRASASHSLLIDSYTHVRIHCDDSTELIARLPELPNKQVAGSSSAPSLTGTRVLIIVNSIELAIQAANSVARAHPHLWVEIEQGAKYKASGLADVTVATYQTLHRSEDRLNKFDPRGLKGVVVSALLHR